MEAMMQHEVERAAEEIQGYLDVHGDAPILTVKEALGKPELYFYMGLGDLILGHRVAIQEREGVLWAIRTVRSAKAA